MLKQSCLERKVRDSCGNSESKGDPRRKCAEEAPGPPAESECLKWKSTSKFVQKKKTVDKFDFHRVCLQSEMPFHSGAFS
jgi:hypothetical protein